MNKEKIYEAHLHALNILLAPSGLRRAMGMQIDPPTLWHALDENLLFEAGVRESRFSKILAAKNEIDVEGEFERVSERGLKLIWPSHLDYPPLLLEIPDKPALLYVETGLKSIDENSEDDSGLLRNLWRKESLASVGPRYPTPYGKEVTKHFVRAIARTGICIVSGLAKGIDGLSHELALEQGVATVAILGCGLNFIYPPENRNLAKKILQSGGALISEYPPNQEPNKYQFPERNRIIAGLSSALFLPEADEKSGGLITAQLAIDYNRDVFIPPGNITNHKSKGSNALLKQGAHFVTSPNDIFEIMKWKPTPENPAKNQALTQQEKGLIELCTEKPIHLNSISEKTKLPLQMLSKTLLQLELKGILQNLTGNWYKTT